MSRAAELERLADEIVRCRSCPRLVAWREEVAAAKRASFADDEYWGRPVPGFGDPQATVAIVGLAPAAHGANRTGRMFTGDRSGDWLYRALWRAGFANRPESTGRSDGLVLSGAWVTSTVRCAPPDNKPTPAERDTCAPWLDRELALIDAGVIVALGGFAYRSVWRYLRDRGFPLPRPRPRFGHGVRVDVDGGPVILTSYHPSQQNTFTGKLTGAMLDDVLSLAMAPGDPGR